MNEHTHRPGENKPDFGSGGREQPRPTGFWRSRTGLVTVGFLAIGGFFLVAEHRAHLLPYVGYALPLLLLLACLPMHFMHGGHGGDEGSRSPDGEATRDRDKGTTHRH